MTALVVISLYRIVGTGPGFAALPVLVCLRFIRPDLGAVEVH